MRVIFIVMLIVIGGCESYRADRVANCRTRCEPDFYAWSFEGGCTCYNGTPIQTQTKRQTIIIPKAP